MNKAVLIASLSQEATDRKDREPPYVGKSRGEFRARAGAAVAISTLDKGSAPYADGGCDPHSRNLDIWKQAISACHGAAPDATAVRREAPARSGKNGGR